MKALFDSVDSDRDGRIDADQLTQVANTLSMKLRSKQHASALISKYGSRGLVVSRLCVQLSLWFSESNKVYDEIRQVVSSGDVRVAKFRCWWWNCISSKNVAVADRFADLRLQRLVWRLCATGDGTINFNEFERIKLRCEAGRERQLSERSRDSEERLRTAFKVFDIDGNGYIDRKELSDTIAELEGSISQCNVETLLQTADKDGDGQIDYEGTSPRDVRVTWFNRYCRTIEC
jgi:Ca2+-binding EF-hand superfamily protein